MDLELARMYGTPGLKVAEATQREDLEKAAAAELFSKLAADNGIDLNALTDAQITTLWGETFGTKLAEMPPQFAAHMRGKEEHEGKKGDEHEHEKEHEKKEKEDKEKEDKEKKAAAELAVAQDERQKLAFADRAGRAMAHAMVNELDSINAFRAKEASAGATGTKTAQPATVETPKVASALDQLAIEAAIEKAAAASIPTEQVTRKLAALLELGLKPSVKIASAPPGDVAAAVDVRALELLEAVGYPVQWN